MEAEESAAPFTVEAEEDWFEEDPAADPADAAAVIVAVGCSVGRGFCHVVVWFLWSM